MQEIFGAITRCAPQISELLKYGEQGYTTHANATGDVQLKLDVASDSVITREFAGVGCVRELVSEEKDDALALHAGGEFVVAYDPLDGSSLVDVNFAVGSIFGIYRGELAPRNLVASAYVVYGPRTELVWCESGAPRLYRLARGGEFEFIRELRLGERGKLNATGATQRGWSEAHRGLVRGLFDEGYRLRYSGAMVADLHQILLKGGGLFSYPATSDAPCGKLRISFEVLPFAHIFEHAGGETTDGASGSLFEVALPRIHATTPCFFGSRYEVQKVRECGLKARQCNS